MATAANADSKLSEGKYKTISFLRNQKRLNGKNEKNTLEYAFAYYPNYDKKSIAYTIFTNHQNKCVSIYLVR